MFISKHRILTILQVCTGYLKTFIIYSRSPRFIRIFSLVHNELSPSDITIFLSTESIKLVHILSNLTKGSFRARLWNTLGPSEHLSTYRKQISRPKNIFLIPPHNQRTNGLVNAHLISGPTVSTKTNKIGQGQPRVIIYI